MMKYFLFGLLAVSSTLTAETKVIAFSGSTRKESCNKKLINNAAEIARKMGANVTVIDLKDFPIPFYDADLEESQGMPEYAKRFRQMIVESNRIIISSPEYNSSLSAVLKNALDWASRTEDGKPSREAFAGKKVAIMSCSPGAGGGARGLVHLRSVITNIGGEVVDLQLVVPNSYTAFNSQGLLESESLREELKKEMEELLK